MKPLTGTIMSDVNEQRTGKKLIRDDGRHRNRHSASASRYAPRPDEVVAQAEVGALLVRARSDDVDAIRELWETYRGWVIRA
jgi:hypothetical protein